MKYSSIRGEAWALILAHRTPILLGLLLMVTGRLASFVLPASSKFLIDTVIHEGRSDLLLPLAAVAIVATLIQAGSSYGVAKTVSIAAQRAIRDLRSIVQAHVIRLPVPFFNGTKTGALISRIMNDPEGIRNLIGTGLVQLCGGLFTATAALVVLLWLNWRLTSGAVAILLLFAAFMAHAFRKLRPIFRQRWEIQEQITGRLGETLGGVRLVKLYTAEEREKRLFSDDVDRLFRNVSSTIEASSAVAALSTIIVGAVSILILIVGGRAIAEGTMTLGDLVMYVFLVGMMVAPLVELAAIGTQITEAFAGLDRIREIRGVATEELGEHAKQPPGDLAGAVVLENVTFGYRTNTPVVHGISLTAPAGTTTAFVGPSGAGKSTILNLIMALHRPDHGRILVDGKDLDQLRIHEYRRQVGVVFQDNFLFDGTIRANIAYSRPEATDDEIEQASSVAHCDEFVKDLPGGYDTIVGERGVKLSAGQRQRVAIARAILARPRILILDEATSSLDSESEVLIQEALQWLQKGRTTFVIAHRLSTIIGADQILVMNKGRVVEAGTHGELLALNGLYRRLYRRQRRVTGDLFISRLEDSAREVELSKDASPPTEAAGAGSL